MSLVLSSSSHSSLTFMHSTPPSSTHLNDKLTAPIYFLGAFKQRNWASLDGALQPPGFSALESFLFRYESPRSPKELTEKLNRVLPALRKRNIEPQVTKLYVRR